MILHTAHQTTFVVRKLSAIWATISSGCKSLRTKNFFYNFLAKKNIKFMKKRRKRNRKFYFPTFLSSWRWKFCSSRSFICNMTLLSWKSIKPVFVCAWKFVGFCWCEQQPIPPTSERILLWIMNLNHEHSAVQYSFNPHMNVQNTQCTGLVL